MIAATRLRRQLAALSAAEAALWRAIDAIHRGHSGIERPPRGDEPFERSSARLSLSAAEDLLVCFQQHRANVTFLLADHHGDQAAWPF